MSTNFFASSKRPELIPYDGDLLDGIDVRLENLNAERAENIRLRMEREERGEQPKYQEPKAPNHEDWPQDVGRAFGFFVSEKFPVHWDGCGSYILRSYREPVDLPDQHPLKGVKFLAIVAVSYDVEITVAIRDGAALLQFYRLLEPMLRLQSDRRFRRGKNEEGFWNNGKEWNDYQEGVASRRQREEAKKGQ